MPRSQILKHLGRGKSSGKTPPPPRTSKNFGPVGKDDPVVRAAPNTERDNADAMNRVVSRQGTGTLLDLPLALARKVPPFNKITDEKYNKVLGGYQKKVVEADRAGGEALAKKNKVLNAIFRSHDLLPKANVTTKSGVKTDAYVPTEIHRLSAPVDKTKQFGVPLLALIGVGSMIDKEESPPGKKEGDNVVQKLSETEFKTLLAEKIASTLEALHTAPTEKPSLEKQAKEKIQRAVELLKQASYKIESLEDQVCKLAEDNKRLETQLLAKERSQRAVKLARDMVGRGMIKQSEFDSQVDYIMGLNDENYSILRDTVGKVPAKAARTESTGVDKLSSILVDADSGSEKPSFADAILNMKI